MIRSAFACAVTVVFAGAPVALSAQTRLPRATITTPSVLAPVTSVRARSGLAKVVIYFLPVPGVTGYRLTRVDNSTDRPQEGIVAEGPPCTFADCYVGLTPPMGVILQCNVAHITEQEGQCYYYDLNVVRGHSYSYRVWALYPNDVVASPSPVATLVYTPQ